MIKPDRLSAGDTIAFISLSSGLAGEPKIKYRWKTAKSRLEELGYKVVLTPNALKSDTFLKQHTEKRAEDLMNALVDPQIKAIISMIGGDDTIRLLPYMDFEIIRKHPKLFVGYSDTTINHFMFHHAGVTSIYGPCVILEIAENVRMHQYTLEHFLELVSGKNLPMTTGK